MPGRGGRLELQSHSSNSRQALLRCICTALALLLVLAGCSLLDNTADGEPSASTASARFTSTATGGDATSTIGPRPDWYTDVESDAGFRIDVPGILSPQHAQYINQTSGMLIAWSYTGAPSSSQLQRTMLQTTVITAYSTQITDHNLCPTRSATPITMGSGIPAWQETDVPPNPSGPPEIYGYVRVSLVLHGEAIQITLEAPAPVDTFFARYGAIWQHMLTSFAALPNPPPATTHPCG